MPKPEGKRDFSFSFRHEKQMLISFFYLTVSGNNWEKKSTSFSGIQLTWSFSLRIVSLNTLLPST